jgi:hypothetical protein
MAREFLFKSKPAIVLTIQEVEGVMTIFLKMPLIKR